MASPTIAPPDPNYKAPVLDDLLAGLETAPRERANEFLVPAAKEKKVPRAATSMNAELEMMRAMQRERDAMRAYQYRERQMEIRRSPFWAPSTLGSSTGTSLTAPPPEDDIPF